MSILVQNQSSVIDGVLWTPDPSGYGWISGGRSSSSTPSTGGGRSSTSSNVLIANITNTSSLILAANSARKECIIVNIGTTTVYLGLGQTPTTTVYNVALTGCASANDGTGGTYITDIWKGDILAICSISGKVTITELS